MSISTVKRGLRVGEEMVDENRKYARLTLLDPGCVAPTNWALEASGGVQVKGGPEKAQLQSALLGGLSASANSAKRMSWSGEKIGLLWSIRTKDILVE